MEGVPLSRATREPRSPVKQALSAQEDVPGNHIRNDS